MTAPHRTRRVVGATVSVNTTVGAPGPTAVFTVPDLPTAADCEQLLHRWYPGLRQQIAFSKALFVALTEPGEFICRFLQIIGPAEGMFGTARAGRDCVNSMIAAYPAVAHPDTTMTLVNVDTGLTLTATPSGERTVDVTVQPPRPVQPAAVQLPTPGSPGILALRVNNPYVLLDAEEVGLSADALLRLDGPADPGLLRPFATAVTQVQQHLGLPIAADLPKLAVVAPDGPDVLAARTVYLGRWHPGLPLTAATTFLTATQIPQSPWPGPGVAQHGLRLRTPAGDIRVTSRANGAGALVSFGIPAREVIRDIPARSM
ncbi:hypothetical protein [Actinoplanes sp. HUAS TT8]|uniref:hypothetical protein n=1 Tax=Actinoplanes sp. HUAS TT8 TaxID=3447453 RepID=UPI003F51CDB8